jgi:hypothetical protein
LSSLELVSLSITHTINKGAIVIDRPLQVFGAVEKASFSNESVLGGIELVFFKLFEKKLKKISSFQL